MSMNLVIAEAAAQYGITDMSADGDVEPVTGPFISSDTSWGNGVPPLDSPLTITVHSSGGFSIVIGFTLLSDTMAAITGVNLLAPDGTSLVDYTGSVTVTPDSVDSLDDSIAFAGNDTLTGNSVANVLEGYAGNDTINGGGGTDTAVFSGAHTLYTITPSGTNASVSGPDGADSLVSVERLHFDDGNVALDITGNAGQAYRLYQAAFNRAPDLGGLGYQMHDLDTWLTLTQVAYNFIASPEFQTTYGNVDDTQFLTLLYRNVLHREPDLGGLQFHLDEMHGPLQQSRADELVHFSESPENQANVMGAIGNGIFYLPFTG
jgi:hypothetical protein